MVASGQGDATNPNFGSAALITIDVQRDTLDGQPLEVPGTSAVVPAISRLCEAFRAAGRPIIHVVRLYLPDGSNAEIARRQLVVGPDPVLRPGSSGRSLAPGVLTRDAELDDALLLAGEFQQLGPGEWAMFKPRWGAFYGTRLHEHLALLGVDSLFFAGCNFPNCPRTSIYEASERDYRIGLADDAVSGLYDRGREELRNIGVHLLPTREISLGVTAEPSAAAW
jgi:nicotinamidase-related amidase